MLLSLLLVYLCSQREPDCDTQCTDRKIKLVWTLQLGMLVCECAGLTCGNLDEAKEDDDDQGQQFGGCEQVLDLGGCSHADAVYKRQGGYRR